LDYSPDCCCYQISWVSNPSSHSFPKFDGAVRFRLAFGAFAVALVVLEGQPAIAVTRGRIKYGPINSWDTKLVTDMSYLFDGVTDFNDDLSSWNTADVTTMAEMFYGANAFNQDLSNWNTGAVTDMRAMFAETIFNDDISSWNTAAVTNSHVCHSGCVPTGKVLVESTCSIKHSSL
jgi:surface protein